MLESIAALFLSLLGALVSDSFVRPRALPRRFWLRSWQGSWIIALCAACLFGVLLSVSGHPALAATVTVACHGVVAIASNAKRGVLGEPIVFSDLAVVGAMVKHPQFYFSVLALWQQIVGALGLVTLIAAMVWLLEPSVRIAAVGLTIAFTSLALLWVSVRLTPFTRLARTPGADADVCAHGLIPTVMLYWLRWRAARAALDASVTLDAQDTPPHKAKDAKPNDIIVVVQCESFADPSEIFKSGGIILPHLDRAKASGAQWGNLHVSGFGAYTMRTEFGVLYGREETELGFLLYDPYLTALNDPARALPQKLGAIGMRSLFVHPHDMRFYSRDQILPSAGFAELIGEESFAKPERGAGRYVSDAAVATKILDLAAEATSPTFIYAVTMENHGPWAPNGDADVTSMIANYNRLVSAGDAMLGQLLDGLADLDRPATLVFFGDHRPTIPGASDPGGDKHTPYVIVRVGGSTAQSVDPIGDQDLTPAQLHEAILRWSSR